MKRRRTGNGTVLLLPVGFDAVMAAVEVVAVAQVVADGFGCFVFECAPGGVDGW